MLTHGFLSSNEKPYLMGDMGAGRGDGDAVETCPKKVTDIWEIFLGKKFLQKNWKMGKMQSFKKTSKKKKKKLYIYI